MQYAVKFSFINECETKNFTKQTEKKTAQHRGILINDTEGYATHRNRASQHQESGQN